MSVSKQGVWSCGKVVENGGSAHNTQVFKKTNENLLKGNYSAKWENGVRTVTGSAQIMLTDAQIKALAGTKYTFSYDLCRPNAGQRSTTEGVGWGENRFGVHLSLVYTNTSGTSVTTYPAAGALETIAVKRVTMTETFPSNYASSSGFGLGLQPYAKPNDNSVWYIKNLKFELGDKATPWCPNSADYNGIASSAVDEILVADNFYEI